LGSEIAFLDKLISRSVCTSTTLGFGEKEKKLKELRRILVVKIAVEWFEQSWVW